MRMTGKNVLLIGATSSIAKALAHHMAQEGVSLYLPAATG